MDLRWFTTRIYPQNGKEEIKGEGKGEGEEGGLGGENMMIQNCVQEKNK